MVNFKKLIFRNRKVHEKSEMRIISEIQIQQMFYFPMWYFIFALKPGGLFYEKITKNL
jgi:hypothetical protein